MNKFLFVALLLFSGTAIAASNEHIKDEGKVQGQSRYLNKQFYPKNELAPGMVCEQLNANLQFIEEKLREGKHMHEYVSKEIPEENQKAINALIDGVEALIGSNG